MAISVLNGTMSNATNSTACQIALGGKARWIYLTVNARAAGCFATAGTGSTGVSTAGMFNFATGLVHIFQFMPGEAKVWNHVATAANTYGILEVY